MIKTLLKSFILLMTLFTLTACTLIEQPTQNETYDSEVFNEVFDNILKNHYTQPTEEQLWAGAINGLIRSLDDPFTSYFSRAQYEQFRQGHQESFVGIGVTIQNKSEQVLIINVWPDSPAENGGLMVGDIITHVDGTDYTARPFLEKIAVLRGEEGSSVEVGFKRPGVDETLFVTMIREVIENPSIIAHTLEIEDKTVGYIIVAVFGDLTADLFETALEDFETQGIDGLIIDVRDNGGGNLSTVLEMLRLFSTSSEIMFSIEYYEDHEKIIQPFAGNDNDAKPYDIVVLVNEQSASASEVYASTMKELLGHTTLGTVTYGKGTMQSTQALRTIKGDYLHLTIGVWKSTDGHWVHFDGGTEGFAPDIIVEQNLYFYTPHLFIKDEEAYVYDQVSSQIANAQQILNALGHTVRTDGYFDQNTETILLTLQTENDLTATGSLNAETAAFLTEQLLTYKRTFENDTQLQAALNYFIEADHE